MGAEHGVIKSKFKFLSLKKKDKNKQIDRIYCPFCNLGFNGDDPILFNTHTRMCGIAKIKIKKSCDLFPPSQDLILNEYIFKNQKDYYKNIIPLEEKTKKNFDDKIKDLKSHISSKKNKGSAFYVSLNRENLLSELLEKVEQVNLIQDWKIDFIGEISYDVGGILREFFSNCFKVLESDYLKLFVKSDTKEFSYNLNPFLLHNQENFKYLKLVGILIAKALMQNVTINICLNKLIYKMI